MMFPLIILAVLGFCVSMYAYFVEKKMRSNAMYKPACDLSDRISCSKPINSKYGNMFFVSNGIAGMIFYILIAVLAVLEVPMLLLLGAIAGCLVSCVMGYILYFKIKSICLICTSLYIINFLILIFSSMQIR